MAENDSDSPLRTFDTDSISLDGRRLSVADLYAVAARPDVTRVRIFALSLESLTMRGIVPKSLRLEPIQRLTKLRRVDITHVHVFGLEDYARLAAALPLAEGHCLQPV